VRWFLFKEGREVRRRFPSFMPYEKALKKAYRFANPFQICKNHLIKQGEDIVDAYGETPLASLAVIAKECALSQDDFLIELGCGRGRGCFFLSHLLGCRVHGIDWVPFFVDTANKLASQLSVTFQCSDMQTADFTGATAIYLYGTCLPDAMIHALIKTLPSLTKIITVSYPLSDYSPSFQTLKQFSVAFPWGEAEVFLNLKKENHE
jgi:SAM-dependent methyltransferase